MSQETDQQQIVEQELELLHKNMIQLFDELPFLEKWKKVREGLEQPKETGEYKWARLQIIRLSAPISAVAVPLLAVLCLFVFSALAPQKSRSVEVKVVEPEKAPELEEIKPLEEPPPEQPEPVDVQTETTNPGPVDNTAISPAPDADFSPTPAPLDSVAIVKSPVIMKGIYGNRSPGHRGSLLGRFGGGGHTEGAVLRALRWLKKTQASDGSWPKTQPAMTGFALLCYLAHGETPASEEFGATVERAIRWMCENQKPDGTFNGADGHNYSQPIAAYALSEAYGLTRVPTVKYAAEKAMEVVLQGQHPSGGWDYNCKQTERDDTSYMAWCAQATKAAKMAGLFENDHEKVEKVMKKAVDGFKKNYGEGGGYGGFGYTGPGNGQSGLTGAGALCMQLLGASKAKEVRGAIASLEAWTFDWKNPQGGSPLYYWYYITQAKFHEGGNTWTTWNKTFSPQLVQAQVVEKGAIEGPGGKMVDIGYWDTPGKSEHHDGGEGARVMDTCLSTLMLEVYYRYLPTFQTPKELGIEDKGAAAAGGGGGEKSKDIDININL
jgi:hypothetical protein